MRIKDYILDCIDGCVADLLWYNRKGDPELQRGDIEAAIKSGTITIDEMVNKFRDCLIDGIDE
jgi:hypothetical protein